MKTQIVTQRILTAEENHYLTDGEVFAKTVVLPDGLDAALWQEISREEKERREAEYGI